MSGFNSGLIRRWAAGTAASLFALLMAAGGAVAVTGSDPSVSASIADVRVEQEGAATLVTLTGLRDPIFTAFKESNPDRVIVEIASQRPDALLEPLAVYNGLVENIVFGSEMTVGGSPMTRVELNLAQPAEYRVMPKATGLVIQVEAVAEQAASAGDTDGNDPWATAPVGVGTESAGEPMPAAATTLTNVDVREVGEASVLELVADGPIGNAETFTLENPDRLVIDLPGMKNTVASNRLEAGTPHAKQVRIGQHVDRVRVVVDAGGADAPFASRRTVSTANGLVVALGRGEALDPAIASVTNAVESGVASNEDTWIDRNAADDFPAEIAPTAAGDSESDMPATAAGDPESDMPATAAGDSESDMPPTAAGDSESDMPATAAGDPDSDMGSVESSQSQAANAASEMTAAAAETENAEAAANGASEWVAEMAAHAATGTQFAEADETASVQNAALVVPDVSSPVTIYAVEYDGQAHRDRVAILGEGEIDYLVYEPSEDTLVLTIQNARIEAEAAVRIAPEPGGPVSLVTAFEQPETDGTEVRVVFKRAAGLKPMIAREGSVLVVDFPRDGSVAATPPVMTTMPAAMRTEESEQLSMTPGVPADGASMTPGVPADGAEMAPVAMDAPVAPMASVPASHGPALGNVPAARKQAGAPAAIGMTTPIEVLQEGGLTDRKEYRGRLISMDFKDIEMADVLRLVAEVSDLNVIAGDEVSGRVTIRLVDVPWDQALDVILLTKGLGFMRVGNVLRIAPVEVLAQEEEMRLQERRALEQLEDLIVKLQPVNFANVQDVRGMVSRLLSARGTVDVDKRTNTVIIKDIPSVVDEATALIKAIDTQTPQVLIESKIVEANLDFSREFGVTWGFGAQPLNNAFDPSSGSRADLGSDAFRLNTNPTSVGNNATFLNPLTAGPTGLFNIAGFLLDEKINLDLQLQAAEVNGDGKVISSPRVVTLDNSQATIEQGVSIPFQTFENGDAQLEFVDAVLKLDVTPHITADRSIIMEVNVSRNAPDDSVFTLTGSPAIAKNQVDTETLVKDGQTLVIGGIYVIDKSERQSRVPYLHAIPILGTLFRSNEISDSRKELLIFVTPRVISTPEASAS